jgi:lysyl-tRNA synthetase class 2
MNWQPTISLSMAQKRSKIIDSIRNFFKQRNVLEVETPALSQGTITDVNIEVFSCKYNYLASNHEQNYTDLYLQTSPEFAMKRLLAAGFGDIFQISKAYRDEGFGRYHNPEFTLLEWYRIGYDHFQLMDEVAELLVRILACQIPEKISYQQLFIDSVGIDPLVADKDRLITLLADKGKLSDWMLKEDDIDLFLQIILSELIEPFIGQSRPCFIYNFPKSQASLAQLCPDDNRVAERFECYFKGVELVNGFHELIDATQQKQRFEEDNLKRKQKLLETKPIDVNFIAAIQAGIPKCAGVALGVDRLIMLACNADHIKEVLTFPIDNA